MEWLYAGNAAPLVLTVGIAIGVLLRDAFDILKGVLREYRRAISHHPGNPRHRS